MVAKHSEHLTIKAGTQMTTEGRIGYEFYVIIDGKATVTTATRTPSSSAVCDGVGRDRFEAAASSVDSGAVVVAMRARTLPPGQDRDRTRRGTSARSRDRTCAAASP